MDFSGLFLVQNKTVLINIVEKISIHVCDLTFTAVKRNGNLMPFPFSLPRGS